MNISAHQSSTRVSGFGNFISTATTSRRATEDRRRAFVTRVSRLTGCHGADDGIELFVDNTALIPEVCASCNLLKRSVDYARAETELDNFLADPAHTESMNAPMELSGYLTRAGYRPSITLQDAGILLTIRDDANRIRLADVVAEIMTAFSHVFGMTRGYIITEITQSTEDDDHVVEFRFVSLQ